MVISQPTIAYWDAMRERIRRALAACRMGTLSRPATGSLVVEPPSVFDAPSEYPPMAGSATEDDLPALVDPVPAALPPIPAAAPLNPTERRARAAAVRGLMLARQRRFGSAQSAFAEAATLDPTLDLATVPTFWDLQRAGQEAVVQAYEQVGRVRDAAMLAARLRQRFRPRALPGPAPAVSAPE